MGVREAGKGIGNLCPLHSGLSPCPLPALTLHEVAKPGCEPSTGSWKPISHSTPDGPPPWGLPCGVSISVQPHSLIKPGSGRDAE